MTDPMKADEKPIALWQKLLAGAVFVGVVACVVVFWGRLGADFIPPDASRVGPNLVASVIQWAIVLVAAVLLWPPWRRRLHRFVDAKITPLHDRIDELHGRHDAHVEHIDKLNRSLTDLHEKLDALHDRNRTAR